MSRLGGIFDEFANLGEISAEEIKHFLKFPIELHVLENFVGNRIIYPQSIPMNEYEMEIDLAILKAVVRRDPKFFYNEAKSCLSFKKELVVRFPSIQKLLVDLSEVLPFKEVTKIFEKDWAQSRQVGTLICPANLPDQEGVEAEIDGKRFQLSANSFTQIPFNLPETNLKINSRVIKGVSGGDWGIFVNLIKR